jgi:hypothetical protein
MTTEGQDDELLLGRLQQAASGDAAVRQLRRRYDLLRRDYEQLLDRLGDVEERLSTGVTRPSAPPSRPPAPAPVTVQDALSGPLLRLRDEYLEAAGGIQNIISGLGGLADAFKGQPALEQPGPGAPRPAAEPSRVEVEVRGGGFGELLDFQERLSSLPGVARVSISTIDNERASLVVELEPGSPASG